MSWMTKLYTTYDHIVALCERDDIVTPWPISHFVKNAHIEVVIDIAGNYLEGRSTILNGNDSPTLIPASESSAGRSGSKIAPHPLCEEIGYCATDYPNAKKKKTDAYMQQLAEWVNSNQTHPKIVAIQKYLTKNTLWKDLSREFEFPVKIKKNNGATEKKSADKVFIRWRIEEIGNSETGTWEDKKLIDAWIKQDNKTNYKGGFCNILGESTRIALNHPRFLRWPGDGAKLISSNDLSGYTFRGRFTDSKNSIEKNGTQSVGIAFEVTQKVHNALRWLISRQKIKNGEQVILAWAVSGKKVPQPMEDTFGIFRMDINEEMVTPIIEETAIDHTINLGQTFATQLRNYMKGYKANLDVTDSIVIMGLDSATPGRMAITYYQEFFPEQYIDQISQWHSDFSWHQRHKKDSTTVWSIGVPSPRSIWEAVYGITVSDSLKKNTVERILPCIVEGRPFPRDLVNKVVQRSCNRAAKRLAPQYSNKKSEEAAWEKELCIACSLFRGFNKRNPNQSREYEMALEENNCSRDYLYGRLLAIAERIEEVALSVAGENRTTTAARLMQRFADRPSSTWRNIELGLQPYIQRLKNNRAGFLHNMQMLLDEVMMQFIEGDFINDKSLSGEFLLAFHSQRLELHKKKPANNSSESDELENTGDEE